MSTTNQTPQDQQQSTSSENKQQKDTPTSTQPTNGQNSDSTMDQTQLSLEESKISDQTTPQKQVNSAPTTDQKTNGQSPSPGNGTNSQNGSPDSKKPPSSDQLKLEVRELNGLLNYDTFTDIDQSLDPHLIFCVHGIGASPEHLYNQIIRMRNTINNVRKLKKGQFKVPIIIKIIDWKSSLALESKEMIEKLTLKSNKKQRTMLNEVPVDILFYLTQNHAGTILQEVAYQANYYYDKLKQRFPNMKCSFVCHSLGTVITYDLLTVKKRTIGYVKEDTKIPSINFPIEDVFFLGSPLGLFLSITDGKLIPLDKEGVSKGFYNIFHPNDLVAYRVEGLIQGYPDLNPEEIPYIKNDGSKKHTKKKKVKERINDIRELAQVQESSFLASSTRYDYSVQEGFFENMFETLGILGGHFGYWDSNDVFYYILGKIHTRFVQNQNILNTKL